jgi:quinol monooxygenase YgiN
MHVRFTLITLDPERIDDVVAYLESDGRSRIESEPGNRGMSLQVAPDLAVVIVETFWVSHDAMRESERIEAAARDEAIHLGVGTAAVERYRLASVSKTAREQGGAGVRLTQFQTDPAALDAAIAGYEDTAVPWLTETDGFISASLIVDRRSGRQVSQTVWRDIDALAKSRSAAAAIRVDAVAATDSTVVALDEYVLVFRSARTE